MERRSQESGNSFLHFASSYLDDPELLYQIEIRENHHGYSLGSYSVSLGFYRILSREIVS